MARKQKKAKKAGKRKARKPKPAEVHVDVKENLKVILEKLERSIEARKEKIELLKNRFSETKIGAKLERIRKAKEFIQSLNFEERKYAEDFLHYFLSERRKFCRFSEWLGELGEEDFKRKIQGEAIKLRGFEKQASEWVAEGGRIEVFLARGDVKKLIESVKQKIVQKLEGWIKDTEEKREATIKKDEKQQEKITDTAAKIAADAESLIKRAGEMDQVEAELLKNQQENTGRMEWVEYALRHIYKNFPVTTGKVKEALVIREKTDVDEEERKEYKTKMVAQLKEMSATSKETTELAKNTIPEARYLEIAAKRLEKDVEKKLAKLGEKEAPEGSKTPPAEETGETGEGREAA